MYMYLLFYLFIGVNHDTLTKLVNKAFSSLPDLLPRTLPKADYLGG